MTEADWLACQEAVRGIHVDEKVTRYILEIVHSSRGHEDILLGGSPLQPRQLAPRRVELRILRDGLPQERLRLFHFSQRLVQLGGEDRGAAQPRVHLQRLSDQRERLISVASRKAPSASANSPALKSVSPFWKMPSARKIAPTSVDKPFAFGSR